METRGWEKDGEGLIRDVVELSGFDICPLAGLVGLVSFEGRVATVADSRGAPTS